MLKRALLASVVCVVSIAFLSPASATVMENGRVNPVEGERVPGVLVIQLANGFMPFGSKQNSNGGTMGIIEIDELNIKYGMSDYYPLFPRGSNSTKSVPMGESPMDRWHLLYFGPGADLDKIAAEYEALPQVEKVEFDYFAYIMRTPNDTQYPQMYQLNQANDRDMDAPEAWDLTVGDPDIVLADTDTGVLWSHDDLNSNIWINPGEDLDGDGIVMDPTDMNGIDDDGNGYIDDLVGWDFVSNGSAVWPGEDGGTQDNNPSDFNGHGTHTSGTIAATTHNGVGVSGVAGGFGPTEPGCKIMCLRMGYSFNDGGTENGRTEMSYVAQAFTYAYRNGATAINYSFGSSNGGGIEAATDSAVAHELVISASAGNSGNSSFGYLQSRSDVLCVASTTSFDLKSGFSNYGVAVDISAPGSSIRSTVSSHGSPTYAIYSGTSMAAPQVVGQVGLIRSLNPQLTRQEVFDIIMLTSDNIDLINPSYAGQLGAGRINLYNSIQDLASTNFTATPTVGEAPLQVQFSDSSLTPATSWMWYFGDGDSSSEQNPIHFYDPGMYDVTLRTETGIGTGVKTKVNFVGALAETLVTEQQTAAAGQQVRVELWAKNNHPLNDIVIPLRVTNVPLAATFDSLVTTGCRTEDFEVQTLIYDGRPVGEAAIALRPDNNFDGVPGPLAPGEGPMLRLWFTMKPAVDPANVVQIDTATLGFDQYKLLFGTPVLSFTPKFTSGAINVSVLPGDIDYNGVHDIVDVAMVVNLVFRGGDFPTPPDRVDANCDDDYTIADVVRVIDFSFRGVEASNCP